MLSPRLNINNIEWLALFVKRKHIEDCITLLITINKFILQQLDIKLKELVWQDAMKSPNKLE